jgi:hypothetical protein
MKIRRGTIRAIGFDTRDGEPLFYVDIETLSGRVERVSTVVSVLEGMDIVRGVTKEYQAALGEDRDVEVFVGHKSLISTLEYPEGTKAVHLHLDGFANTLRVLDASVTRMDTTLRELQLGEKAVARPLKWRVVLHGDAWCDAAPVAANTEEEAVLLFAQEARGFGQLLLDVVSEFRYNAKNIGDDYGTYEVTFSEVTPPVMKTLVRKVG